LFHFRQSGHTSIYQTHWCTRRSVYMQVYMVRNDVRRLTKQPKLTAIIQSRRLTLFGHIMCMDNNADAKRILLPPPSGRLEKTTGSSPHHMAQHHPTGSETSSYASRSSRFGSDPPSVEDDVDVWRYATVSCLPETTTMYSISQQIYSLIY